MERRTEGLAPFYSVIPAPERSGRIVSTSAGSVGYWAAIRSAAHLFQTSVLRFRNGLHAYADGYRRERLSDVYPESSSVCGRGMRNSRS
jgi:hypothetical protein